MSKKEILLEFIENHNGIITYKDCKALKIPTIYLTRLEKEGIIYRVEKGIFLTQNGDYDEYYFFQYRYPKAIFSYISALYLQQFTDEIPQYFDVTIPRGYRFNTPPENLNIHSVSKEYSELGITLVKTPMGNEVRVYDLERIICDFVIHREKIDTELFVKTLQHYGNYSKKNLTKLYEYATKMNTLDKVKQTLEVLV
ncbi:TPA: type IV toxin-antitoxin system AbiEi family antitoxin domain-containing protein [Streptococcus suis]|uniref:type IV toxin-antitoxin system AbiEi family antitoxin domain-containing protein n=1 Tax=Streptococcus suis TaxID=1307 RepID=UPI001782E662|nr:type IV toxin-antitoxin system AbiEi family antitoxin domain-containing protein [Streptococcus suis]MDW8584218.1 type IV toxin-antitoxin system AbiEi family antitoxin domain-containing protein [Streptococcus suis]MDW8606154.1 type IV toxin-antitoxin system AbiEi family antitoxin domain-containing protein [Streptococcus suis]MDW8723154.1 type IV toxin-antitoxin system AbiEi family antitoxin domain-containing protein [Streptococcus suis]MDW8730202.1 type IV toxin-antitoxin system AbiEi family 